jgi:hypothetical protein
MHNNKFLPRSDMRSDIVADCFEIDPICAANFDDKLVHSLSLDWMQTREL